MSYGPATPTGPELMHQLAAMAIHRGGWVLVDATVGGVPLAAWPAPEAPPPALVPGDVAVVRPTAAQGAGGLDVISFTLAVDVDVALVRRAGGLRDPWDLGTHAPVVGAISEAAGTLAAQALGTYGDVVIVDQWGLALVQIDSAGVFGARRYWGYMLSAARNPDGTGEALGEDPLPFPFGWAELDETATASFLMEFRHFVEGDVLVTSTFPPSIAANEATRSGHDKPTVALHEMWAEGDEPAGPRTYVHGRVPMLHVADLGMNLATTLTQVRDPVSGDRYLAFGNPTGVALGPLNPPGGVSYRILTYGGPPVP